MDLAPEEHLERLLADELAHAPDRPYVFHLGAQAHVGESWHRPYETVMANTLGTLNLLQSIVDNGLELENVAIVDLDQTSLEFFDPSNAFDAEGLTQLTESIETRRKMRNEIEQRERSGYPPFGRLAGLVVTANDKHTAEAYGRTLANAAPKNEDVRVLGPAEAPIAVVRGRHRFRLLVKSPRAFDLSAYLREWLANAPKPRGNVRLEVDIDPQSFY